jgi:outer membrane protein OmpA-like peptidoglycan-associated protein
MIVPTRLSCLAGLIGFSLCVGASAEPVRLPAETLILAQNQPNPPQPQSEEEKAKEHKKGPSEKATPKNAPPGKAPVEKQLPASVPPPKVGPGQPPAQKNLPSIQKEVPKPPPAPPSEKVVPRPPKVIVPHKAPESEKKLEAPSQLPAPAEKIAPPSLPKGPLPGALPKTVPGPAEKIAPSIPAAPAPQGGTTPAPSPGRTLLMPPNGAPKPPQPAAPGAAAAHAGLPKAPPPQGLQPGVATTFTPGFQPPGPPAQHLQDLQKTRTQHTEDGGKRVVIEEPDNRLIVKQDNRTIVRHDETLRLAGKASNVRSERRADGMTETIIVRPGGVQIYNVVDGGGRLVRRYRRDERSGEINIIDNRRFYEGAAAGLAIAAGVGIAAEVMGLHLGPPRIGIPRDKYIVDYDRASDDDIYEALTAPPLEPLDRAYSLEEIRYNVDLRDRMRRIDLDTITFDFGAWDVTPDQYGVLARIAAGINRAVDRNPGEVFLIEGYTDAVGSDIDNLSLSDRRAQAIAEVLTEDFDVPPENLVTQGYGEEYLKIPTDGPERANRRVAVRRITPLMSQGDDR